MGGAREGAAADDTDGVETWALAGRAGEEAIAGDNDGFETRALEVREEGKGGSVDD